MSLCACLVAPLANADIYKWVDENGVTHFTNRPTGSQYVLVMRTKKRARRKSLDFYRKNRKLFSPLIEEAATKYQLDTALLHAVIRAESAYDPNAISGKGAVGLMQLMPATAARYGISDRHNPTQNIDAGTRYLRDLLAQFSAVHLALAAYNAGENAVIRYGNDIPPYPETQNYVRKVLGFYEQYRKSS